MSDAIQEAIETLTELKRMHQLNFELLEQLNITCQWIVDNDIKIPNENLMRSLISKSLAVIAEIQADVPKILQYASISRRKVTDYRTDAEVTEPLGALYK